MWIPRPRSAGKAGSKAKGKGANNRHGRDDRDGSEARGMRTESEVVTHTSQHESSATIRPMLPNSGAMSTFVGAFEVTSKLTGKAYQCRFSHMWNGIATRHADTIDTKFYVDGEAHIVGLAHPAFWRVQHATHPEMGVVFRTSLTHQEPICEVDVSIVCGYRAAGR